MERSCNAWRTQSIAQSSLLPPNPMKTIAQHITQLSRINHSINASVSPLNPRQSQSPRTRRSAPPSRRRTRRRSSLRSTLRCRSSRKNSKSASKSPLSCYLKHGKWMRISAIWTRRPRQKVSRASGAPKKYPVCARESYSRSLKSTIRRTVSSS